MAAGLASRAAAMAVMPFEIGMIGRRPKRLRIGRKRVGKHPRVLGAHIVVGAESGSLDQHRPGGARHLGRDRRQPRGDGVELGDLRLGQRRAGGASALGRQDGYVIDEDDGGVRRARLDRRHHRLQPPRQGCEPALDIHDGSRAADQRSPSHGGAGPDRPDRSCGRVRRDNPHRCRRWSGSPVES